MDGFVVVYRASGMVDAQVIKGFLESEGIPASLSYESAGQVYGFTMDGLGEVRVYVPEAFAEAAVEALSMRNQENAGGEDPDAA